MDDSSISAKVKHTSRLEKHMQGYKVVQYCKVLKFWLFSFRLLSSSVMVKDHNLYTYMSKVHRKVCDYISTASLFFENAVIIFFILWQCDYNFCWTKDVILCQWTTWHMIKKQHLVQNDHPVIQFSIFCKWDMDIVDLDLSKLLNQI